MHTNISIKQQKLLELVSSAMSRFNENENYLISRDLSERCICSKFASYLEKELLDTEFESFFVDVEYNRGNDGREDNPKMLDRKNIVVDLVVHMRGYNNLIGFNNLICIEMKKSYKKLNYQSDIERLKKLTDAIHGFHYVLGLMILIDADKKSGTFGLRMEHVFYGDLG